jgi:hypothetical protein
MTVIDRSISSQSKNLLLVFGGLVVVATTLSLILSGTPAEPCPSKKVSLKDVPVEDEPVSDGNPKDWTDKQLLEFLSRVCKT